MKILLALLVIYLTLQADHVRWLGDYNKALKIAQKTNKPLMVYLIKKDQPQCSKILKDNFFDKEYVSYINKNFIPIIVVYDEKQSYPNEMIYANSFPTLFLIDSKNELFLSTPLSPEEISPKTIKKVISYE